MRIVLLVEDDSSFVQIMKEIIETEDIKIYATGSVEQAILWLKEYSHIIGMIWSDYNLENEKTCLKLLTYVRSKKLDIPVVVVSANEYEDCADKVKSAGALAYYDKVSLSLNKIRDIVRGGLK